MRGENAEQELREGLEPAEALALAIVGQAAEDWRRAADILRFRRDDPDASRLLRETERFFRSRWFRTLVDLDGEEFLGRLRREAGFSEDRAENSGFCNSFLIRNRPRDGRSVLRGGQNAGTIGKRTDPARRAGRRKIHTPARKRAITGKDGTVP